MIVALENAKHELIALRATVTELGSALRIEETKENLKDLEAQTQAPDFWNDAEKSGKVRPQRQGQRFQTTEKCIVQIGTLHYFLPNFLVFFSFSTVSATLGASSTSLFFTISSSMIIFTISSAEMRSAMASKVSFIL